MTEAFVDPVELKAKKQDNVQELHPGEPSWEGGDSIRARELAQPNEGAMQQGVRLEDTTKGGNGGGDSESSGPNEGKSAGVAPNLYKDVGALKQSEGGQ